MSPSSNNDRSTGVPRHMEKDKSDHDGAIEAQMQPVLAAEHAPQVEESKTATLLDCSYGDEELEAE